MSPLKFSASAVEGLWSEFWRAIPVGAGTINFIPTPKVGYLPLPLALYIIAVAVFFFVLFYRKGLNRQAALVYSFIVIGALLALRMDYNWVRVFRDDFSALSGRDTRGRITTIMKSDFFDFIKYVGRTIPEGEAAVELLDPEMERLIVRAELDGVRKTDLEAFYIVKLGKYYLLPRRTSSAGRFIWVFNELDISYDNDTKMLRVREQTFRARPFAEYRKGAMIFERLGG
jgi:hypothetical protein